MSREWKVLIAGDSAVVVSFGESVDPLLNQRARRMWRKILDAGPNPLPGIKIVEAVPTYRDVCVYYDPADTDFATLCSFLEKLAASASVEARDEEDVSGRRMEIPTVYGGRYGPDLEYVAAYHGITPDEVIKLHSGREYLVYMIGFSPGFPYLGGLPSQLITPRRKNPRKKVPAGAVGIGGHQTAIMTITNPSGWNYIGRTPVKFFDLERDPPSLLRPGDRVVFVPVSEEEGRAMGIGDEEYE